MEMKTSSWLLESMNKPCKMCKARKFLISCGVNGVKDDSWYNVEPELFRIALRFVYHVHSPMVTVNCGSPVSDGLLSAVSLCFYAISNSLTFLLYSLLHKLTSVVYHTQACLCLYVISKLTLFSRRSCRGMRAHGGHLGTPTILLFDVIPVG